MTFEQQEPTDCTAEGIALGQDGRRSHISIIGHVWLAWLRQAQADVRGSHDAVQVALQLVQQHQLSPFWPLPSAACCQARLWIAQGNLDAASRWSQASRSSRAGTPGAYLYEAEDLTLARLYIAQGDLAAAEALLLDFRIFGRKIVAGLLVIVANTAQATVNRRDGVAIDQAVGSIRASMLFA